MAEVADLYASLGARVKKSEWDRADAVLQKAMRSVKSLDAEQQREARRAEALLKRKVANEQRAIAKTQAEKQRAAAQAKRVADKEHRESIARSEEAVGRVTSMGALLGGLALYLGGRSVKAGLEFNSTMEGSKNQIAGMLALTKKTHLADEMKNANTLVANLQRRAATLPGTTAEYVSMLSNITQPITDAKLGMQDLEDITVNSVVAAKAFRINAMVAARDIDQAIRGQYHSVDPFTGKVLGSLGYKGEEGRSRYNALSQTKRATELKRGLLQPQITELAAAQGAGFSGTLSTLQDSWEQFQGAFTKPLFEELGKAIKQVNKWLDENKAKVAEVAGVIGNVLLLAFKAVGKVFEFFMEHGDLTIAILIAIGSTLAGLAVLWIAGFWPIFVVIAAVSALIYGIRLLMKHPDKVRAAFSAMWEFIASKGKWLWDRISALGARIKKFFVEDIPNAIKDAWEAMIKYISDLPGVKQIIEIANKLQGAKYDAATQGYIDDMGRMANPDANLGATMPASRTGTTISVQVGDLNVSSPSADGKEVAMEVSRVFDEKLAFHLRETLDVVG